MKYICSLVSKAAKHLSKTAKTSNDLEVLRVEFVFVFEVLMFSQSLYYMQGVEIKIMA